MSQWFFPIVALGLLTVSGTLQDNEFIDLFNGTDLTGWKYGDVPPKKKPTTEILDGKTESSGKRFEVKNGLIYANPGKGGNMAIYTAREFNKDFHLQLEFRTDTENKRNNSGVFIRGPQLQLDGVTEGGLTKVFKNLKNFKAGDWNQIDITVKGTLAICTCNGEYVTKMKVPATGTIGLQSEIGTFAFRKLRVKELP